MARKRMIDPSIWINEDFGTLSTLSKLDFIGLFSLADDEGRGKASPAYIKAVLFPYKEDLRIADIEKALQEVSSKMSVIFYSCDENMYYTLTSWDTFQTINKPTESTGRAAPPQSATGTVLTTQRTCTPKSKDETSRRHPETQRERPGTPTNNTQTFIWRAPDLFQTNLTGSTNKTTKNPDVIRKHTFTGETFAAECKHRSEIRYDPEKNIHCIQW